MDDDLPFFPADLWSSAADDRRYRLSTRSCQPLTRA